MALRLSVDTDFLSQHADVSSTAPCGSRFSFVGWRCGVQILFQRLAGCADDSQNIIGYVAWVHHLTHCWDKLIARR